MDNQTLSFSKWSYNIRKYSVPGGVTSIVGWSTLYFVFRALMPGRTPEWHCRMVTLMHALLVVGLSSWSGFVQGPWPFTDPAGPNTPLQSFTSLITLGYFTFDLAWCLYYKAEGAPMIIHHVLCIAGNFFILHRNINGTEMMAALFGTEITNPLLQIRFFLRYQGSIGKPASPFVLAFVDLLFLALFTIMRIVLGSMLLHRYLLHPRPDWIARFFAFSIYVVSWVFWFHIVRYAFRKYVLGSMLGRKRQNGDVKSANDVGEGENFSEKSIDTAPMNALGDN